MVVGIKLSCPRYLVVLWRKGHRIPALGWFLMAITSLGLVVGMLLLAGSRGEALSYYPLKTMWTASVLVLPMAVVGVLWLSLWATRKIAALSNSWVRLVGYTLVAGVAVAVLSGVTAGWWATPPKLGSALAIDSQVPMQIPAITALEELGAYPVSGEQGVLAWGVSPYVGMSSISDMAGPPDWLTREATS